MTSEHRPSAGVQKETTIEHCVICRLSVSNVYYGPVTPRHQFDGVAWTEVWRNLVATSDHGYTCTTHVQNSNHRNGNGFKTDERKHRTRNDAARAQFSENCATSTRPTTSQTHKPTAQVKCPLLGCKNFSEEKEPKRVFLALLHSSLSEAFINGTTGAQFCFYMSQPGFGNTHLSILQQIRLL